MARRRHGCGGNTAVGPSDTITGVAPKAYLGSYKVFGSPGVNDYTLSSALIQALDDAYNDGMDIAVLSLGAPALSGPLDTGLHAGWQREGLRSRSDCCPVCRHGGLNRCGGGGK